VLFFALALTGCVVATRAQTSVPATGSHSAGPSNSQIGDPPARGSASLNAPNIIGAGSFPRSFLIPGDRNLDPHRRHLRALVDAGLSRPFRRL
jgi:hypothetical protein